MSDFKKEVYIAYGLNDEVLYVGQGNIGRNNHCSSGCSHNKQLNRYYFLNGEDGSIRTEVFAYTNCDLDALSVESKFINSLKPRYNIQVDRKFCFRESAEEYYTLSQILKSTDCPSEKQTLYEKLSEIKDRDTLLSCIIETIGIEGIKSTHYHITKSKNKYEKALCLKELREQGGIFNKGEFYTYSEIKDSIQKCYNRLKVDAKAKATDIKSVYNVKRTKRNGVEGFLIGEKL